MPRWTCPECKRQFGRKGQGHECAPAMTIEEYFDAAGPEFEREIFEAVNAHLQSLGDVHVEPVSVGIFFKTGPRIVTLRTMTKWIACGFSLPSKSNSSRIARKVIEVGPGRWYHVVNLRSAADVDDQLEAWLTEAYLLSPAED